MSCPLIGRLVGRPSSFPGMTLLRLDSQGNAVPADTPRHRDPGRAWRSTARWQRLRAWQVRRSPICATCGATSRLTADHVVPVADGGDRWGPANLQTLCVACNSAKRDRQ